MTYQLKMNALLGIDEDIEARLKNRQKGKEFKDTGVAKYTRKYRAAYDLITYADLSEIEKDSVQAYRLIDKSKVWPPYKPEELKAEGNTSGAAYLKVKAREALSSKPMDTPEARQIYVRNIERLINELKPARHVAMVMKVLMEFTNTSTFDFSPLNDMGSYKAQYYLIDLFSKRFFNFCRNNSESVRKIVMEAFLYQKFTEEERQIIVEKYEKKHQNSPVQDKNRTLPQVYDVRDDDWSWANNKKTKTATSETTEDKPRSAQNIYEKFGIDTPKNIKRAFLPYVKRTGGLEIKELSTEAIVKTFGFNRVVYGNYVNDKESKEHTRHVLGALLDLMEVCNINIVDINQLGGLDLNIGATGCGTFSKAVACYFPSLKAINLTKNKGDGSLAHEWGHYLDNVLIEGVTKRATNTQYVTTAKPEQVKSSRVAMLIKEFNTWLVTGGKTRTVIETFFPQSKVKFRIYGETLEEAINEIQRRYPAFKNFDRANSNMSAYYGYLAKRLNGNQPLEVPMETRATDFYYHSSAFEPVKYYLMPQELFARAFEAWVEYKLEKMGRYNNYLTDTSKALGILAMVIPRHLWYYPTGKELEWLDDWFTRLFSAIRTDYGIKPFNWNTKERVDEYTEYADKATPPPAGKEKDIKNLLLRIRIAKAKLKLLEFSISIAGIKSKKRKNLPLFGKSKQVKFMDTYFVVRDTYHPQEDLERNWSAPLGGHSNELSGMTFNSEEDAKEAYLRIFDTESPFEYRFHPAYNSFSEVHYEGLGAYVLEAETIKEAIKEANVYRNNLAVTMEAGDGRFDAEDVVSFHKVRDGRYVFEIKV